MTRAVWLADVLRAEGLSVVEEPGWKTRGLPGGTFSADNVVWHHDASTRGPSPGVVAFMLRNFATGCAQLWVCLGCGGEHPVGTWHVIAAGRCAHAGEVRRGKPTNSNSLGVETDHTTGEDWHPSLLSSLRRGTAAILRHRNRKPSKALHFHKTICFPRGRKQDPDGLTLRTERRAVSKLMVRLPAVSVARLQQAWQAGLRGRRLVAPVQVVRVQRALGMRVWSGLWRSGTRDRHAARFGGAKRPSRASLEALGKGRFRVVD